MSGTIGEGPRDLRDQAEIERLYFTYFQAPATIGNDLPVFEQVSAFDYSIEAYTSDRTVIADIGSSQGA